MIVDVDASADISRSSVQQIFWEGDFPSLDGVGVNPRSRRTGNWTKSKSHSIQESVSAYEMSKSSGTVSGAVSAKRSPAKITSHEIVDNGEQFGDQSSQDSIIQRPGELSTSDLENGRQNGVMIHTTFDVRPESTSPDQDGRNAAMIALPAQALCSPGTQRRPSYGNHVTIGTTAVPTSDSMRTVGTPQDALCSRQTVIARIMYCRHSGVQNFPMLHQWTNLGQPSPLA